MLPDFLPHLSQVQFYLPHRYILQFHRLHFFLSFFLLHSRTNESTAAAMMRHIADKAEHISLALVSTDFRKQQAGLAALVSLKFKLDPYCGKSVFLFCNKKHNSLRALRWDGNGFILVTKFSSRVYKCTECGKNDTNPYHAIYCATVPAPVLTHSFTSPSIVAWVMYQKYMMSMPLCRQEKDFIKMGIELKRDMMANWMIRSSEYWLKPIYDEMHKQLLTSSIIMSDETTWQVNHENGKKASGKSFIWIHRTGEYGGPPIILYEYTSTRSGDHAKKFLEGFQGYHVSDAYAGYEKVEGITRCLCFSHLRRYYLEAIPLDSNKKEISGSGGAIGQAYCDKLFRLERKWKELSPEERKKNRLLKSVPVLDAFFAWAENTFTNQENLKKALKYTLNHKKYFTNFLIDGRIPLSNNLSEIAVKPVAITRKNSLFSDSAEGAEASAIIFSIVNTAAANNLDAYKYLEYLFRRLPNSNFASDPSALYEYLPWADKVQLECRINTAETEDESCNESA